MGNTITKGHPVPSDSLHFCRPCQEVVHPHSTCNSFSLLCFRIGLSSSMKAYAPLFLFTTLVNTKFKLRIKEDLVFKMIPALLRSCFFLAVVAGMFPFLLCAWCRVGNHSGPAYFALSFLAAFVGILLEKPHRRSELAVYAANQAVELIYRMAVCRGIVPPIKNGLEILFTLSFSLLVYFHRHHRSCLANSINGLLKVIVGVENEMDIVEVWVSKVYFWYKLHCPKFLEFLFSEEQTSPHNRRCHHIYGCKTYATVGFLKAFLLAVGMKASFVVLPVLLLSPQNFFREFPKYFSKAFGRSTLRFALFWGIMSGGPRGTECFLRWARGTDDGINSAIAGFVGGLGVVFFSSIDVAMYIASKAAESLYYFALEKKWVSPKPFGSILLFALSTASLFYGAAYEPHNLRLTYFIWLLKCSQGQWAHFFKAFTPVRLEAGLPDLAVYQKWEKNFADPITKQYITPEQIKKYYSTTTIKSTP